jgi:excisionase family DNA binding protein
VAEVTHLLRLNPQTVRNWIDRGQLPAVRVGERRVRIRQSDLDEFLAAGATARDAKDDAIAVAEELGAEQSARLGTALAESTAALADEDHRRLADALNSLADAARGLAEVISEREIRSDGSAADQRAERAKR